MKKINYTLSIIITLTLILFSQMYQMRTVNAIPDRLDMKNVVSLPYESELVWSANENIENVVLEPVNDSVVQLVEETIETESVIEETEPAFITSSPDITFTYNYIIPDDAMPYALLTPSTAKTNEKTPLIISLHGMGDRGTSANAFKDKFIAKMMRSWELDGFNAYVMIPHLTGGFYSDYWNNQTAAKNLFELIDRVILEYNIDTDRIVIQGQSMGGHGCLYMAAYRPNFFSAVVPVSAYNTNIDLSKLENTPIRCYVGTPSCGEDRASATYVMGTLKNVFGEGNVFQKETSHDGIPILAFEEDLNGDNKSDLVEWMLAQTRAESTSNTIE